MMMAIREELDNPHKPKTWDVFRESLKVELRSLPFQQLPQSWLWMFCVYSYNLGLIRWRRKALDFLQTPSLSYSRMSWLVLLLLDEEEKCGNGEYLTIQLWTILARTAEYQQCCGLLNILIIITYWLSKPLGYDIFSSEYLNLTFKLWGANWAVVFAWRKPPLQLNKN